jgi:hypothetical protein
MNKYSIFVVAALAAISSACGSSVDVKTVLESHQMQMKQCYESKNAATCDAAIAILEQDIPKLQSACSSGNSQACGLFPGYDQVPAALRQYKSICVDNQVDASIPDNMKQYAQQGMKAACDKIKLNGSKT